MLTNVHLTRAPTEVCARTRRTGISVTAPQATSTPTAYRTRMSVEAARVSMAERAWTG